MALNNIATMMVSRSDATAKYFSRDYLYKTQRKATGPLQRILAWLKSETLYFFDTKHMTLGKEEDDFVFIYYHDGVRYKMGKDGLAYVSGADAEDPMEDVQAEMQRLIDTIINDEICAAIRAVLAQADGVSVGKTRHLDADEGDDMHTRTIMGVLAS